MSLQFFDSFSRYGTGSPSNTAMRDGLPYNNWISTCQTDPDPLAAATGGRALLLNSGLNNDPLVDNRISLPTPRTGTVGLAARFWFTTFPSGNGRRCVATFCNNFPTALASLIVESNGALTLKNALTGSDIATTTSPVVATNSWNHIEVSYNGTTGAMEVRVNGITRLTGTASATGTIAFVQPINRIGSGASSGAMYVKDMVIWDNSGTQNNTFVGSVVVRRQAISSDIALGSWVPSTGVTGTPILDKTAVNDSTFLSADVPPSTPMRYNVNDLAADVTSVRGVMTVIRGRKIDGGDANVQVSVVSNSVPDAGVDRPITTAYTYYFDIFEVDPDTGAAWTPAAFNAIEVEIDRTV